jgi:hypothetical protein
VRGHRVSLLVAAVLAVAVAGPTSDGGVAASGPPSALAVSLGWIHTCALLRVGSMKCRGYNDWGQLGDGTQLNRLRPAGVSGMVS